MRPQRDQLHRPIDIPSRPSSQIDPDNALRALMSEFRWEHRAGGAWRERHAESSKTRELEGRPAYVYSGDGPEDTDLDPLHPSNGKTKIAAKIDAGARARRRPSDPPSVEGEILAYRGRWKSG